MLYRIPHGLQSECCPFVLCIGSIIYFMSEREIERDYGTWWWDEYYSCWRWSLLVWFIRISICYFMPRKINKRVRKQRIRVMAKVKYSTATRLKPKLVLVGLWLHKCTWKVVLLKKVSLLYVCKHLPSISQASKCCGDQPTWQNVFYFWNMKELQWLTYLKVISPTCYVRRTI